MTKPTIVCLCGSTRFHQEWLEATYNETMQGRIVLGVAFYPHGKEHGETIGCTPEQKLMLDELHRHRIDLSDEILVLNVGGYIGESTRTEIAWAWALGKKVRWLEPDKVQTIGKEALAPLARPSVHEDGIPWCACSCPIYGKCGQSVGNASVCLVVARPFIQAAGLKATR